MEGRPGFLDGLKVIFGVVFRLVVASPGQSGAGGESVRMIWVRLVGLVSGVDKCPIESANTDKLAKKSRLQLISNLITKKFITNKNVKYES